MLGRENVIDSKIALGLLLENLRGGNPPEVNMNIEAALGMVASRDVISGEDLPSFARSTVDGYAVRAEDTFGATETMPAYLNLFQEILMSQKADFALPEDNASKIPTGGMLPENADAIVMFEHVQIIDDHTIEVLKPVAPGENVIQVGEDVKRGEVVIRTGQRLRPQDIGACAGIGVTQIPVFRKPAVSIISTGDEIVPADEFPGPGKVRDINSYVISGMVSESGGISLRKGILKDEYKTIRDAIETAMTDSEAIVLSGGTSVGTKDMVARIINDIGAPGVLFHGLSLKPGKPMIGGVIKGIPVFGLPGHPAAVSICFELFIKPVLQRLSGLREKWPQYSRKMVRAKISKNIASSAGREEHVRVMLEERGGELWAVPVLGKSGLITTLVRADGTIVIPLHLNGIEAGEAVDVRLF
ncbi:MAG: molybdopterin molybdenumtransferase MoeA [Nitrospiraceae bacterium]|nr:MAG: molybdopterin molybdenumtransferase MoeA [Nitrospiraceae bacterium]